MQENNTGISNTNNSKYMAPRAEGQKPTCVVITYSVSNNIDSTIESLQERGASVHYIIDQNGQQYQYHNDLTEKTFYAGKSEWKGEAGVNDFGIGIMLVNNAESNFSDEQIKKLTKLLTDIEERYPDLDLKNDLVGLGEVAVRHVAPGKFFPWLELAEAGFGRYFKTTEEQKSEKLLKPNDIGEKVKVLQENLKAYGYGIEVTGEFKEQTNHFTEVFNTRYGTGLLNEEPPVSWTGASEYVLSELLGKEPVTDDLSN